MIQGLSGSLYADKLVAVGLGSLETRRTKSNMVEIYMYKILSGHDKINTPLFENDSRLMNLRCHSRRLRGKLFRRQARRNSLSQRVINTWNSLPECEVSSPSLKVLKLRITKYLRKFNGN